MGLPPAGMHSVAVSWGQGEYWPQRTRAKLKRVGNRTLEELLPGVGEARRGTTTLQMGRHGRPFETQRPCTDSTTSLEEELQQKRSQFLHAETLRWPSRRSDLPKLAVKLVDVERHEKCGFFETTAKTHQKGKMTVRVEGLGAPRGTYVHPKAIATTRKRTRFCALPRRRLSFFCRGRFIRATNLSRP